LLAGQATGAWLHPLPGNGGLALQLIGRMDLETPVPAAVSLPLKTA